MITGNKKPFRININIKQTKDCNCPTQLMIAYTINRKRTRLYTGLRVEPKYWDNTRQRCGTDGVTNIRECNKLRKINHLLDDIIAQIYDTDHLLSQRGNFFTADSARNIIRSVRMRCDLSNDPITYLHKLVDSYGQEINRRGSKGVSGSKTTYNTALVRLENFIRSTRFPLNTFEDFGKRFFDRFTYYLYNFHYHKRGVETQYTKNTIINTIKVIKNLLHRAYDNEVCENDYFNKVRTILPMDASDKVYLTEQEIKLFSEVQVNSRLESDVRNIFTIACYTALRISDMMRLNQATIGEESITLYQFKTKDKVVIPILKEISHLIQSYSKTGFPVIDPGKTNKILKTLSARAGITTPVTYKENRGGITHLLTAPKYTLISFHTARRSCLTNLYKRGYNANYLMSLSGHRSIMAFQRYLRTTSAEMATEFMVQLRKDKAV